MAKKRRQRQGATAAGDAPVGQTTQARRTGRRTGAKASTRRTSPSRAGGQARSGTVMRGRGSLTIENVGTFLHQHNATIRGLQDLMIENIGR